MCALMFPQESSLQSSVLKKTATTKNYPINNKYYQELYEDKAEKCLYEKNSTCLEFCGLHYADHISFVNDFVKR